MKPLLDAREDVRFLNTAPVWVISAWIDTSSRNCSKWGQLLTTDGISSGLDRVVPSGMSVQNPGALRMLQPFTEAATWCICHNTRSAQTSPSSQRPCDIPREWGEESNVEGGWETVQKGANNWQGCIHRGKRVWKWGAKGARGTRPGKLSYSTIQEWSIFTLF